MRETVCLCISVCLCGCVVSVALPQSQRSNEGSSQSFFSHTLTHTHTRTRTAVLWQLSDWRVEVAEAPRRTTFTPLTVSLTADDDFRELSSEK